jgi:hypothetical protein
MDQFIVLIAYKIQGMLGAPPYYAYALFQTEQSRETRGVDRVELLGPQSNRYQQNERPPFAVFISALFQYVFDVDRAVLSDAHRERVKFVVVFRGPFESLSEARILENWSAPVGLVTGRGAPRIRARTSPQPSYRTPPPT